MKNGKKKKILIISILSIIGIVTLGIVIIFILYNGIDLNLSEYQRISVDLSGDYNHPIRVIDSSEYEQTVEKEFGIDIKDGTDYSQYSLIISKGYEIKKFTMFVFDHPGTCSRGDEKCSSIAMCYDETGDKYDNIIIVYIVRQKNIISGSENGITWLS